MQVTLTLACSRLNTPRNYPNEVRIRTGELRCRFAHSFILMGSAYCFQVNASSLFELPAYSPGSSGKRITCPVKLIPSTKDNLCPYDKAVELSRASSLVELVPLECGECTSHTAL